MDFVERMNRAGEYIEDHLGDDMEPGEIARIVACPFAVFQRSFIQITGIPVSEYVRRRKLTCAAYELQNTEEKIIDIALKYGYDSPDAFAAAFKRLHGVSPSKAREPGVKLSFYCHLSFTLTMKGVSKMDYTVIERKRSRSSASGAQRPTAAAPGPLSRRTAAAGPWKSSAAIFTTWAFASVF